MVISQYSSFISLLMRTYGSSENTAIDQKIDLLGAIIRKKEEKVFLEYAVNTESEICSIAGAKILEKGGNAVDAAISAALCIGVVNLFSAGIGGGGFLLMKNETMSSEEDKFLMLDFRETSPERINISHFRENPEDAKIGPKSVCTPGEIFGFYEAHKRCGKLEWEECFEEAIRLCEEGFIAEEILITKLKRNEKEILDDEGLREIFTIDGKLIPRGHIVKRPNLGKTLRIISKDPMSFYNGEIAKKIDKFMKKRGGYLTIEDLNSYKVKERSVINGKFSGYDVYTTNIPTSGPFVLQALNVLDNFDFNEVRERLRANNFEYMYHVLIEIFKFMYSKRGEMGDPEFLKNWIKKVSLTIDKATSLEIFKILDFENVLDLKSYGSVSSFSEDHGTTHLNVVDKENNAVLITTTINLEFGSRMMDPETGILFNDHIDDFSIPGVSNAYDLNEMEGNVLEPKKRPFSSAAPTILIGNGEMITIGAAGGTRIPTSIVGVLLYYILGNSLEDSIRGHRIHDQLHPDLTFVESTFPPHMIKILEKFGHKIIISEMNTAFTSVQAIQVTEDENGNRILRAVSDHRKKGKSSGK